jgi:transposase-like protein
VLPVPLSRTLAAYTLIRESGPNIGTGIFIPVTNAIEALNSKLRRAVRARGHFPNDEAATNGYIWFLTALR